MGAQMRLWRFAVLLLALTSALATNIERYAKLGGSMLLKPTGASKSGITDILWRHNGNMMAEWMDGKLSLTYFDRYKNRTTLDIGNGFLELSQLNKLDAGLYKVQINSEEEAHQYDVKIIAGVPTPEVTVGPLSCGPGKDQCTLTCSGEVPADAQPVTYTWKEGDQSLNATTEFIDITNDDETRMVEWFTCGMRNPVSETQSEPKRNPFLQKDQSGTSSVLAVVLGIVIFAAAAAAAAGVAYWKRDAIIRCLGLKRDVQAGPDTGQPLNHQTQGEA